MDKLEAQKKAKYHKKKAKYYWNKVREKEREECKIGFKIGKKK